MDSCAELQGCSVVFCIYAVEPLYNEVLGTMEIALLYRVSPCIRIIKKKKKIWGAGAGKVTLLWRGFGVSDFFVTRFHCSLIYKKIIAFIDLSDSSL